MMEGRIHGQGYFSYRANVMKNHCHMFFFFYAML